jgi:hypothetical protein
VEQNLFFICYNFCSSLRITFLKSGKSGFRGFCSTFFKSGKSGFRGFAPLFLKVDLYISKSLI